MSRLGVVHIHSQRGTGILPFRAPLWGYGIHAARILADYECAPLQDRLLEYRPDLVLELFHGKTVEPLGL